VTAKTPGPCPVEAVFGPGDRVPCLLERGHEPPHKYTPDPCGTCGCLPGDTPCGGCTDPGCPCVDPEAEWMARSERADYTEG
jgi:hypothetical protein